MKPTAYEWGLKSPADHFPPETRAKVQHRDAIKVKRGPCPVERERRQSLARAARNRFPSTEAMARALGASGGGVGKWLNGKDPVPEKYLESLEQIAGGAA